MLYFVVTRPGFLVRDCDIVSVFGRMDEGRLIKIEHDDLAEMAVEAGIFPSKSQACEAGLEGPAPHGVHLIGTKKTRFWVWCPHSSGEKVVLSPCFDKSQGWF
jgi:hypothetical protein